MAAGAPSSRRLLASSVAWMPVCPVHVAQERVLCVCCRVASELSVPAACVALGPPWEIPLLLHVALAWDRLPHRQPPHHHPAGPTYRQRPRHVAGP